MNSQMGSHSKGLRVLIIFYAFVMIQNILGWRQFGGSSLVVSVISGTIAYVTIGLIRRKPASWFIAVVFHIAYQLMITFSVIALYDSGTMQELYRVVPAESVPAAKAVMIAAFCILTAANVLAVRYLLKNRKFFASIAERE